jgi:hypothetical protein
MSTVVVAQFKSKRDADFVAKLIKKFRKNAEVMKGDRWEDYYLGKMIEEGEKNGEEISENEFMAFLEKKIKSLS